MGDSGSMLIGLVLSASAVTLSGQFSGSELTQGASGSQASLLPTLLPVLLPISILIVPIVDLLLAVVRRTRAGRSPFAPDKQHLHHRLLEIGHSQRRAVFIMWMWAAPGRLRHRAGQPLHRARGCGSSLAAMALLTVVAHLRAAGRPQAPAPGATTSPDRALRGTRFPAPPDFVLVFTSTEQRAHDRTAATMTTALRRPPFRAPRNPLIPAVEGPARCGSFAPSSTFAAWTSPSGRSTDVFLPANESDPGGWPMSAPTTHCRGRDLIGLGGLLAGSVVAGTVLGLVIDNAAGTAPAFTLIGVGLGIVAGAVGFWLKVRAALRP